MSITSGDRLDNLPQSDVFLTSIAGVSAQLKRFFPDRSVPVVQTAGMTHFRSLFRKDKKIRKPFFAIMPSSVAEKSDGYNAFVLHKRGRIGPRLANTGTGKAGTDVVYHFMPANAAFRVLFMTDDSSDVYALGQRWLVAARNHYLDFAIEAEGQAAINIKVNMDKEISFPDLEMEETGESITVELNLNIDTYHGVIAKRVVVTTAKINLSSALLDANSSFLANLESRLYRG